MIEIPASGPPPYHPAVIRRRSPIQSLIWLVLLAAVLLVFIGWLGDWRRRHNIDTLMTGQANVYASMTTDAGALPLNLKPTLPLDPSARLIEAWVTADEARLLRGSTDEVLVTWTVPLVRALGRNERAVIVFHQGAYSVRWIPLAEFNNRYGRQVERLKKLNPLSP